MQTSHFDLTLYRQGHLEPRFKRQMEQGFKYDVIISNPPWLVSKPLDIFIDSGNYDQKQEFLEKMMMFVSANLCREKGVFYLIYSDLSQIIGTQKEKTVETMAKEKGLSVSGVYRFEGIVNMNKVRSRFDGLKQKAATVIYEITF